MKALIPTPFRLFASWFGLLGMALFLAACGPKSEPPTETRHEVAPETPAAPPSSVVAFEGARVIPGDGSPPIENAVFTIDGGRFLAVGPAGKVAVPAV